MRLRQGAVDMLNRTLTAGLLPLDLLRGVGLHALAAAPALRRRLMEQGLAPPDPLPALMASDGPQAALPRESLSA
jgi:2-octaprenyl-6-methoxyphenol hydroxylase